MELELGRSLALFAAWCIAEGDERGPIAAASAKSLCADAAVAACERSIQAHGGIGFTWEHVLHRLYKRALWIQSLGGVDARSCAPRWLPICSTVTGGDMQGLTMDYELNVPAILRRAEELFGDKTIASRLPDKTWHSYTYARLRATLQAARAGAAQRARPRRRRPRRDVRVEPPRAPGDLHRGPGRRLRHAHAQPAAPSRRPHLHRNPRRRPGADRRQDALAARGGVQGQGRLRARRRDRRRRDAARGDRLRGAARDGRRGRVRGPRHRRAGSPRRCVTRAARRGSRRASSTRIARS